MLQKSTGSKKQMAASLDDILTEFLDLDQEVTDQSVLGQLAQLCQ